MAPITTYLPAEDGSGRTVMRVVYDDGRVWTKILPVGRRGLQQGNAEGKRLEHAPGVDTGSLERSEQ